MSTRDTRQRHADEKLKEMQERLKTRGFTLCVRRGYNGDFEDPTSPYDELTIFAPDKRICAKVKMNTGTGWYFVFQSWKLNLPTYEPRGDDNQREHRHDPADPDHWGFANIKAAGTVVSKIEAALEFIPTSKQIAVGKLHQELDTLQYKSRDLISERKYALRDKDVLAEVAAILTRDDIAKELCSERLQKQVRKLSKVLESEARIAEKRDALWAQISELEKEEAA